jgi:F-type H+-transporting ATPase subunit delta
MAEFRASHRYALALIGVAEERNKIDEIGRDCQLLEKMISDHRDVRLFLASPVINAQKKRLILEELLRGRIGETMLTFVYFLASRNREGLLPQIITEFFRLRDDRMGILNVTASVAVTLTPAQEQRLISRLQEATGKTVRMTYNLDPSLKAGFTVRLEDTVWDASVRHDLENLRRRFIEGTA